MLAGCIPYPHIQHDYPEIFGQLISPIGLPHDGSPEHVPAMLSSQKQAECDKFIDHAQIADGYLCKLTHFVSVFVFSEVFRGFFVPSPRERSDRRALSNAPHVEIRPVSA